MGQVRGLARVVTRSRVNPKIPQKYVFFGMMTMRLETRNDESPKLSTSLRLSTCQGEAG